MEKLIFNKTAGTSPTLLRRSFFTDALKQNPSIFFKKIPQNLGTVYWKNTSLLLLSNILKTFLFLKTGFCNFPFHNSMKFSKFSPTTLTSNCGEFLGLLKYHWDTIKQWFHWNKIFSKTYPSCKQYLRLCCSQNVNWKLLSFILHMLYSITLIFKN